MNQPNEQNSQPSHSDAFQASESDAPKRRGRPPGSKSRSYELIVQNDLACPACGKTVTKIVETPYPPISLDYEHVGEDGFVYNRITWQNRVCECGQFVRVKKRSRV
jgi:hypothetical protein